MTVRIAEGEDDWRVVVEGVDAHDRPWQAQLEHCAGNTQVRAADVNGDGANEVVIAHAPGWANGACAELRYVTIISLNSDGVPIPWRTISRQAEGNEVGPLTELGDWDGDGLAEWIEIECYGYEHRDGHVDGDRGWTAVYEADGDYWRKLSADEVDRRRATYQSIAAEGRLLATRRPEHRGYVGDFGNKPTGDAVQIESFVTEKNRRHRFLLSDGRWCEGFQGISIDRPLGRTVIVSYSADRSPEGVAMLAEISASGYAVRLAGRRDKEGCYPTMIWAVAP